MRVAATTPPRRRARLAAAGTTVLALALAGCAGDSTAPQASNPGGSAPSATGGAARTSYPLSIQNCDQTLQFTKVPARVVSLAQPQTTMLAELGVADRIVGQAQVAEPDGLPGGTDSDAFRAENLAGIPVLSADGVPSREVTIAQEPDLVVAPTVFEFDGSEGYATLEELQAAAANPYLATGGCPERRLARSVDDNLTDIDNLGKIFDVQDRAQELAQRYRATLDEVTKAIQGRPPLTVAELYVFGDSIEALAGSSERDLVRAAGGQNIFTSDDALFGGKLFAQVSPEIIAAREPQAIIVSVSSQEDADAAVALLRMTFASTPAVRDNLIIPYSATASLPGSLSLADAVRDIARKLHPEAF